MDYKNRHIERKFLEMSGSFKAVMVTGARQVGKTTMLKYLAENTNRSFVTLDNFEDRSLAREDPELFFQKYPLPILIDEVQKCPELFERIKIICDSTEENGQIWMTGSESARLRKLAGESLAGRVCILKMHPYSFRERCELNFCEINYSATSFDSLIKSTPHTNINDVYDFIIRGEMPGAENLSDEALYEYYNSYINNYLIRDISEDFGVTSINSFVKFLRICAANIARQLNISKIAKEADISLNTAKSWLDILMSLNIVYLLYPYQKSLGKRLAKMPKLYFLNSGLACFLTSWHTKSALLNGAESGHYFENFAVTEFIKHYSAAKKPANLYFYRDKDKNEIDLIVEADNKLNLFEIKKSARIKTEVLSSIRAAERNLNNINSKWVLCMKPDKFPLAKDVWTLPAYCI